MKSPANPTQVWLIDPPSKDSKSNVSFCASRDVKAVTMADEHLIMPDIKLNLAHIIVLQKAKIISASEYTDLRQALLLMIKQYQTGDFKLNPQLEDVHMNIEHWITTGLGIKAGTKMHTARSRNDQAATCIRIMLRERMSEFFICIRKLAETMLLVAKQEKATVIPGFSHGQPAMVTTFGHQVASWLEVELRNMERILSTLKMFNKSPLGACAGFGTYWAIDRHLAARLLGFDAPIENTIDAVSSRGEMEGQVAWDLSLAATAWSKIAQDLIFLSHPYCKFISIPPAFTTGSSIMPHKNNPDFAEIIRAKAAFAQGAVGSILAVLKGLPTGYNRDVQNTKYLAIDLTAELIEVPEIIRLVLDKLKINRQNCRDRCLKDKMMAIDIVDWLVANSAIGFRQAYQLVREASLKKIDFAKALKQRLVANDLGGIVKNLDLENLLDPDLAVSRRKSFGSPNPLLIDEQLAASAKRLGQISTEFDNFYTSYQSALADLIN